MKTKRKFGTKKPSKPELPAEFQVEQEDGGVLASEELSPPINASEDVFPYDRTNEAGTLALVDSGAESSADEDDLPAVPGFMKASSRNAGTFAVIKVERDKGNIHFRLRADIDPDWMVQQQRARQAAIEAAAELERKLAQVAEYKRKSYTNQLDRKRPRRIAATAAKSSASAQQVRPSEDPLKHLKSEVKLIRVRPKSAGATTVVKKAAHKIGRVKDKKVVGKRQLKCDSERGVKFAGKSPPPQKKKPTSAATKKKRQAATPVQSPRGKKIASKKPVKKPIKKPKIALVKSPRSPKTGKSAKSAGPKHKIANKVKERMMNVVSLKKVVKREPKRKPLIAKKEPKSPKEKHVTPKKNKSKIPVIAKGKPEKKSEIKSKTPVIAKDKPEKKSEIKSKIQVIAKDKLEKKSENPSKTVKTVKSKSPKPAVKKQISMKELAIVDEVLVEVNSLKRFECSSVLKINYIFMEKEISRDNEIPTISKDPGDEIVDVQESNLVNAEENEVVNVEPSAADEPETSCNICPIESPKIVSEVENTDQEVPPEPNEEENSDHREPESVQEFLETAEKSIQIEREVVLQVKFAVPEPPNSPNEVLKESSVEEKPVEDEINKFKMCETCGWMACTFENYKPDPPKKGEEAPPPVEHGDCPKCSRDVIKERPSQADCINCRGVFGSATMFELEFDFKTKRSKVICTVCRGPLLIAKKERRVKRVPPQGLRLDIKRYPILAEMFDKWAERFEKNAGAGLPLNFDQLYKTIYQMGYADAPELNVVRLKTSRGKIPPRPKYDCPTTFKLDYKYRGKGDRPEHPRVVCRELNHIS